MSDLSEVSLQIPFTPDTLALALSTPSFHPTLTLHLNLSTQSSLPNRCNPIIALTLPDLLFPDPDELRDRLPLFPFIRQWHLMDYAVDIERPERRGNDTLNSLILGFERVEEVFSVEVPLHARYLQPNGNGMREIKLFSGGGLGSIQGGWNCDVHTSSGSLTFNTLPTLVLPELVLTLPTGRPSHQPIVEIITTLSIWLAFAWLVYKIIRLSRRYDANNKRDAQRTKKLQ